MKLNSISTILFLAGVIVLQGCIKDDKFGFSTFNEIKAFEIPGQAGGTTINKDERAIVVPMGEDADITQLAPSLIEISNLATVSPKQGEVQDFSDPVIYTVTAEDGSTANWTVTLVPAVPNPQLPNSNFDQWFPVSDYFQPGENADNTIWDTANRAVAIAGDANTTREDLGGGDFAAKMTSVAAPLLVRMAAATMFTGDFTTGFPSPTDPRSNIDFGIPFSGKPSAFKLDYRYLPGDSYEDGDGNPLPGGDQCDIYVLLQKREGDQSQRIGTGWFRSDAEVADFTELEVEIKYGELTAADPEFEYADVRTDEGETWGDPDDTPTHIVVVFSSSALGDFFTGAIGSELTVNNFELVY